MLSIWKLCLCLICWRFILNVCRPPHGHHGDPTTARPAHTLINDAFSRLPGLSKSQQRMSSSKSWSSCQKQKYYMHVPKKNLPLQNQHLDEQFLWTIKGESHNLQGKNKDYFYSPLISSRAESAPSSRAWQSFAPQWGMHARSYVEKKGREKVRIEEVISEKQNS